MVKRAAFVFLLLTVAASLWAHGLPRVITTYYQDWNYVVENSTGPQRQVLWSAYRSHATTVLSGTEQEILVRMNRIADATDSRHYSMPMLLAGSAPPVTSELLVPTAHGTTGPTRLVVQVRVLQPLVHAPAGGPIIRLLSPKPRRVSMCQYTDEWTFRDGRWRVLRSPAVWVALNRVAPNGVN